MIVAAGMVIVAAAALCIKVSKESVVSNELFEENVDVCNTRKVFGLVCEFYNVKIWWMNNKEVYLLLFHLP